MLGRWKQRPAPPLICYYHHRYNLPLLRLLPLKCASEQTGLDYWTVACKLRRATSARSFSKINDFEGLLVFLWGGRHILST